MATVTRYAAVRPRDFVRVAGPDAEDFLQRMLSNDIASSEVVDALLLTAKGRLIAPVRVWRRGAEDFLLGTEPGLGEAVRTTLVRARFAAKCEIEPEQHSSVLTWSDDFAGAEEQLDAEIAPNVDADTLERARIEAGVPAWGKELDDTILAAEAGLDATHVSFTKGCFPGQEPLARLHYRGHANRKLRRLEVASAKPGDEVAHEGKVVGRVTSAVPGHALAYVRREVPDDAAVQVGGEEARLH